ncbi:type IIL restriction-modification enzyme MmeI, partial [Succinimonas sp.]|uniref:type IIL restriction-modification enzyme MmeI n=1 Tax=Succinimonas sp. TaxID=1936151 RepID=UPI003868A40B
RSRIEKTASGILAARKLHPESSLSELYNDDLMPFDLRKAHEENDKAVLELYGLKATATEDDIVEKLFKMYSQKIKNCK